MMRGIRRATEQGSFGKLRGEIEGDESFVGGKARSMHVAKRQPRVTGTGRQGQGARYGNLGARGESARKCNSESPKSGSTSGVKKHVEAGSALYTDALLSYEGLAGDYAHQVVDCAVAYVDGRVHTNGLENFWSLLKRGVQEHMSALGRFTCFGISTSKPIVSTIAN